MDEDDKYRKYAQEARAWRTTRLPTPTRRRGSRLPRAGRTWVSRP